MSQVTPLDESIEMVQYLSAIKWLPNMGGTAEFGWGRDGPRGTGPGSGGLGIFRR